MSPFSSALQVPEPLSVELDAGERVLWTDQPSPSRMRRKALPALLFSLPMGAFMVFWIWGASAPVRSTLAAGKTLSLFFVALPASGLLGLAFVLLLFFSPWIAVATARRTFYALTDRRALVVVAGNKKKVQSVTPQEFSLVRRDLSDGSGDLIFKRETTGTGEDETTTEIGFFGIPNAPAVERMARDLAARSR